MPKQSECRDRELLMCCEGVVRVRNNLNLNVVLVCVCEENKARCKCEYPARWSSNVGARGIDSTFEVESSGN